MVIFTKSKIRKQILLKAYCISVYRSEWKKSEPEIKVWMKIDVICIFKNKESRLNALNMRLTLFHPEKVTFQTFGKWNIYRFRDKNDHDVFHKWSGIYQGPWSGLFRTSTSSLFWIFEALIFFLKPVADILVFAYQAST